MQDALFGSEVSHTSPAAQGLAMQGVFTHAPSTQTSPVLQVTPAQGLTHLLSDGRQLVLGAHCIVEHLSSTQTPSLQNLPFAHFGVWSAQPAFAQKPLVQI